MRLPMILYMVAPDRRRLRYIMTVWLRWLMRCFMDTMQQFLLMGRYSLTGFDFDHDD